MSIKIIILFIMLIFSHSDTGTDKLDDECLETKGPDITLSSCTSFDSADKKGEKIDPNHLYCCLLTIYKKNEKEEKYCLKANKTDRDSFDNRIEMFKLLNRSITDVTIDCSSNYFYISIIFIIVLLL